MSAIKNTVLAIRFCALPAPTNPPFRSPRYEFHIRKDVRIRYKLSDALYATSGNVIFADFYAARLFAAEINKHINPVTHPERVIKAGKINAMALIDEILHALCELYRSSVKADAFALAYGAVEKALGKKGAQALLLAFIKAYPPSELHQGLVSAEDWLKGSQEGVANAHIALEELLLLRLANENPAFEPFNFLFDDRDLRASVEVEAALAALELAFKSMPGFGPDGEDLLTMLRAPMKASPYSLAGQLDFMRKRWGMIIGNKMRKLLGGVDMLAEEDKPFFPGPGPTRVLSYEQLDKEYERFSEDKDWMPRVVMIAKSTLVWLDQLSKAYGRPITTLDAIPDEELDVMAHRGFNALWLIGLWERSAASRRIKELCGNPEAAASAYSLFDYEIANELGGWAALENLRGRAAWRGIRLAADMVPNHTGIDSAWVRERPGLFIQRDTPPFPGYSFTGENLSSDGRIGLWLEDHYYDRRDAAVVFKRVDFASGHTSYIYHGNDGTSMPWNDTAQIDFLKPEAREAVRERILHVARNFPIIRFDAAMIMAKRHFRRLWYPEPGHGGDIASRGEYALPGDEFNARMPEEFWREVVDLCAAEAPDTLLLAEAFWMMEGYFVRTLGMHRVYNSAFMNMLKNKENRKYRETIKNTQEFDKDILKRFVNFMNNPDEDTAVAQFGKDDHYFGVCTLMATLPGLPMFGHGQVEGLTEKYGMEYRRAYKDERPDSSIVERHEREIFPILKKRYLFSGVEDFLLYDFITADGGVNQDVFAYSNGSGRERALVIFNNAWERASGSLQHSCPFAHKRADGGKEQLSRTLAQGLGLSGKGDHFLIMREQRSNLWYLRHADDIAGRGLYAVIDGFQCQVFLDIQERADDELGSYAKLCGRLAGAGVPDLSAALQDVALEELYAAWNRVFGKDYMLAFRAAFQAVEAAPAKQRSVAAAAKAKKTASAQESLPFEADSGAAQEGAAGLPSTALVYDFARTAMTYMVDLAGAPLDADDAARRATACAAAGDRIIAAIAALSSAKGKAAAALRQRLLSVEGALEGMACVSALLCLPPLLNGGGSYEDLHALVDRWCLDRKLREAMQAAGAHGDCAWRAAAFAKAALLLLERMPLLGGKAAKAPIAGLGAFVEESFKDEEVSRLLGVNVWDGVTWFNAERFSLAQAMAAGIAYLEAGDAAKPALDALASAAEASGWNLAVLLEKLKES